MNGMWVHMLEVHVFFFHNLLRMHTQQQKCIHNNVCKLLCNTALHSHWGQKLQFFFFFLFGNCGSGLRGNKYQRRRHKDISNIFHTKLLLMWSFLKRLIKINIHLFLQKRRKTFQQIFAVALFFTLFWDFSLNYFLMFLATFIFFYYKNPLALALSHGPQILSKFSFSPLINFHFLSKKSSMITLNF